MKKELAVQKLYEKFGKFGINYQKADRLISSGIKCGMSVKKCYNINRYFLSRKFGTTEGFSVDDIMEMSGLSRAEVEKKLEDLAENLSEEEYVKYFTM